MKELDLLLESFIEENQQALERDSWPELEALLHKEDDVLWAWVRHPDQKDAKDYREVLERIRQERG